MIKSLAIGEVLWDLLPAELILGGAPVNFSVRFRELGGYPQLLSRVGADAQGKNALGAMAGLGIDISLIQIDSEHETGSVRVSIVDGQPNYEIVTPAAYDFISWVSDLEATATGVECIYFGTLAQRSSVSSSTIERLLAIQTPALKFLDMNLRPGCWDSLSVVRSLTAADVVKLNDAEAEQLMELGCVLATASLEDFAVSLAKQWNLEACVVTLGSRGAISARPDGEAVYVPSFPVPVIDTVGAGDAFSAGFVYSYLSERDLAGAIQFGNAMGALAAARPGGTTRIEAWEMDAILDT